MKGVSVMLNVRKLTACTLAMVLSLPACCLPVSAEGDSVQVYVTIADGEGKLALTQKPVTVTDTDGDGALTIYDALFQAHEDNYKGGAKAGFEALPSEYGLSLEMLWGTANGGSFGYYVNHTSAWSLNDVIKTGDYVDAFVYTDSETWTDVYSYFDVYTENVAVGDSLTLTLTRAGYDENWQAITLPVENATITINGKETKYKTDADGKVTVKFTSKGKNIVSAVSDTLKLVPPACVVTASEKKEETVFGDTDLNGEIDILDVITLNKSILGKETLSDQAQKNADVDQNKKINNNDSLTILKYIVKLVDTLPVKTEEASAK